MPGAMSRRMRVLALLSVVAGVCFYGAQVALCLRRSPPELWPAEPLAEAPRGWSTLSSTVVSRLVVPRVDLDSWATAQPTHNALELVLKLLSQKLRPG